jgi:hypothetical protein
MLITLKPSKGQKRTNDHKRASNMCQDAHHYKIKVHVNLICSIFSPSMSVLTTNENKEMVWEAKAKRLIQVNEDHTRT